MMMTRILAAGSLCLLAACSPQQQQAAVTKIAAVEQDASTLAANACSKFRQAEANPLVQAALPAGEALAGAAIGAVTGGIATPAPALAVSAIKSFGDNYCQAGPPAGDTTTPAQQAAWLDGVTAQLLGAVGAK